MNKIILKKKKNMYIKFINKIIRFYDNITIYICSKLFLKINIFYVIYCLIKNVNIFKKNLIYMYILSNLILFIFNILFKKITKHKTKKKILNYLYYLIFYVSIIFIEFFLIILFLFFILLRIIVFCIF